MTTNLDRSLLLVDPLNEAQTIMDYFSAMCDLDQAQREEQGQIAQDYRAASQSNRRPVRFGKGKLCACGLKCAEDCNCPF
jgi:hypothetical protein